MAPRCGSRRGAATQHPRRPQQPTDPQTAPEAYWRRGPGQPAAALRRKCGLGHLPRGVCPRSWPLDTLGARACMRCASSWGAPALPGRHPVPPPPHLQTTHPPTHPHTHHPHTQTHTARPRVMQGDARAVGGAAAPGVADGGDDDAAQRARGLCGRICVVHAAGPNHGAGNRDAQPGRGRDCRGARVCRDREPVEGARDRDRLGAVGAAGRPGGAAGGAAIPQQLRVAPGGPCRRRKARGARVRAAPGARGAHRRRFGDRPLRR